MNIDLHIHSTASDGTLSPEEIIVMAGNLNLAAIAITDHDTIDGSKAALQYGIPSNLKFLTGVEISASPPPSFNLIEGSIHILAYSIRLDDYDFNKALEKVQKARVDRNPRIIERLNTLGMDISMDEVISLAGVNGQTGRPHIAQCLLKKGFIKSFNEAFDKYLGKGKPAYVDKDKLDCAHAIKLIKNAGGIPVLAHPYVIFSRNDQQLEKLVLYLTKMGLMGIEVFYPEHSLDNIRYYTELARRCNLLMTGGTDFHGSLKPEIKMGTGRGGFKVPYSVYEKLVEAL